MCALENGMKLQKRQVSRNSSVGRFHWSSTHVGSDRRHSSTWSALATPAFRKLWIAGVVSGTCVAAHDTAAIWIMNMLTPSPFLISLLSTVASLPFFLFTLPAGTLADLVDRKKVTLPSAAVASRRSGRSSDSRLVASSQSLRDPGFRISHRSRFRSECAGLDVKRI